MLNTLFETVLCTEIIKEIVRLNKLCGDPLNFYSKKHTADTTKPETSHFEAETTHEQTVDTADDFVPVKTHVDYTYVPHEAYVLSRPVQKNGHIAKYAKILLEVYNRGTASIEALAALTDSPKSSVINVARYASKAGLVFYDKKNDIVVAMLPALDKYIVENHIQ